jgi:hypothetical protein
VADLHAIGDRLGLAEVRVFGRNWLGLTNSRGVVRAVARGADHALRLRPSLCSDIYLTGCKRGVVPAR